MHTIQALGTKECITCIKELKQSVLYLGFTASAQAKLSFTESRCYDLRVIVVGFVNAYWQYFHFKTCIL